MTAAPPPALRLFGAPVLNHRAGALSFRREQRFRVLGFLATAGTPVDRDTLAGLFWPDERNEVARRNLRKTLFDLRRLPALAASDWQTDGQSIAWDIDSDLRRMQQALAAGDARAAAGWYGGSLLQGLDGGAGGFQDWLDCERERQAQRWRTLALACIDAAPDDEDALVWSERMLAADPLDERAMRAQVRALCRRGQIAAARRCHERWRARMHDELGLPTADDFAELAGRARPPQAPVVLAHSPQYLTTFVGRSAELARLRELLCGPRRLVTVLGPPGCGKTRLAAEAFESLRAGVALRLAFVELDRLPPGVPGGGHAELVMQIARSLRLALAGAEMSLERLADEVGREPTLLLLDNIEHRLADLPVLARLLREPQTRLLVTSRVRLELDAECVLSLDGLAVEPRDAGEPESSDALRLFEARCRTLGAAERAPALALCRLLQGQPLAIELAARACRALAPAELLERLQLRLDSLATAAVDLPPRQRSLRAAFDASWQLLPPTLRAALARLAVLPAGFSAATARAVAWVDDAEIAALVDHSLLRPEPAVARLRWHPFVHHFAFDVLAAQPALLQAAQQRQVAHFVAQLQRLNASEIHPSRAVLRYLAAEIDNLGAAWQHALTLADTAAQAVLAEALALYHEFHARCDEGAALLAASNEPQVTLLRARLLHWIAPQRAEGIAESARAALAAAGDVHGLIAAARVLGLIAWRRGETELAARRFAEGLALGADRGLQAQRAILLDGLGLARIELGDRAGARDAFNEALLLNEASGNELQIVQNLINLALDARHDDPGRAVALAQRSLDLAREIGFVHYQPHAWITLALAHSAGGDGLAARRAAAEALAATRCSGDRYAECWAGVALAEACLAGGDSHAARAATRQGLALAWQIGDLPLMRQHLALCAAPADSRAPIAQRVHEALGRLTAPAATPQPEAPAACRGDASADAEVTPAP